MFNQFNESIAFSVANNVLELDSESSNDSNNININNHINSNNDVYNNFNGFNDSVMNNNFNYNINNNINSNAIFPMHRNNNNNNNADHLMYSFSDSLIDFNRPVPTYEKNPRQITRAKLFVGQIPSHITEQELLPFFTPFGHIIELIILKDALTGSSRGCGFVVYDSYTSAQKAIDNLHNRLLFNNRQLIVRHASSSSRNQPGIYKLFVGMLSKQSNERQVRELFERFGPVEEVFIIRNASGASRGCAFVKYRELNHALNAINTLHDRYHENGSPRPLNVRFANSSNRDSPNRGAPNTASPSPPVSESSSLQQLSPISLRASPVTFFGNEDANNNNNNNLSNSITVNNGIAITDNNTNNNNVIMMQSINTTNTSNNNNSNNIPPNTNIHHLQQQQQQQQNHQQQQQNHHHHHGRNSNSRGPAGANLFVYNLPSSYRDDDLRKLFSKFGVILSTKVFIDKVTNQSRGFGFVSFNEPSCADYAISEMDGFAVGTKRLQVAHKISHN